MPHDGQFTIGQAHSANEPTIYPGFTRINITGYIIQFSTTEIPLNTISLSFLTEMKTECIHIDRTNSANVFTTYSQVSLPFKK